MRRRPEHYRETSQLPLVSAGLGEQIRSLPLVLQELIVAAVSESLNVVIPMKGEDVRASGIVIVCAAHSSATPRAFSSMHITNNGIKTNVVVPQLASQEPHTLDPASHPVVRVIIDIEGSHIASSQKVVDVTPEIIAAMEEMNARQKQLPKNLEATRVTTRHQVMAILRKFDPRTWSDASKRGK